MKNNRDTFDVDFLIPQNFQKDENEKEFIYSTSNKYFESKIALKKNSYSSFKDSYSINYKSHEKYCEIYLSVSNNRYIDLKIMLPNEEVSFNIDLNRMSECNFSGHRNTNNSLFFKGNNPIVSFKANCYDGYIKYSDAAFNTDQLSVYDLQELPKYSNLTKEYLVQRYGEAYHKNDNLLLSHLIFIEGIDQIESMPTILESLQIALKELDSVYLGIWNSVLNIDAFKKLSNKLGLRFNKNEVTDIPKRNFFINKDKNTVLNIDEINSLLSNDKELENVINEYDNLPYNERNQLLDNLFYGNLNEINITNINYLIAAGLYYNDYDLLESIIGLCNKNGNNDLLFFIIDYMSEDYLNSKIKNVTDIKKLKNHISRGHNSYPSDLYERNYSIQELYEVKSEISKCTYNKLFHRAAILASIHNNNEFFDKYKDSPIDDFRINLSGFTNKPEDFINDTNRRIQKIAKLRTGFISRMSKKDPNEVAIIDYLTNLLVNYKIKLYDGALAYTDENGNFDDEFVCVKFEGDNIAGDYISRFDNDIFTNIKEKGILAESIMKYIKNGELSMKNIPEKIKVSLDNIGINSQKQILEKGNI